MPRPYQTTTKAAFAADAARELAYVLSALGLQDDHGATTAVLAALQGGSSRKRAAQATADTLRRIKLAIRALIEGSKRDNRDRDTYRDGERFWHREAERLQTDKETLAKDLDYWQTRAQAAETETKAPCGCNVEREYCDACAMPDPRDPKEPCKTADRGPGEPAWCYVHGADCADGSCTRARPPLSPHRSAKLRERRAKRQAADDAQRIRDRQRQAKAEAAKAAGNDRPERGDPVPTIPGYAFCTSCGGTDRLSDGDEGSYCAHCGGTTTTTKANHEDLERIRQAKTNHED
jgi:hypothetical protein